MTIYLHPIDKHPQQINQDNWVEIDLLGWDAQPTTAEPTKVTLIRRLEPKGRQPCLQTLMFTNLYDNQSIDELTLEIPQSTHGLDYQQYRLRQVNVLTYTLCPAHTSNHKHYEKLVISTPSNSLLSH